MSEVLRVLKQIEARLIYLSSLVGEAKTHLARDDMKGKRLLLHAAAEAEVILLALKEEVETLAKVEG